jgi:hypothetical protein
MILPIMKPIITAAMATLVGLVILPLAGNKWKTTSKKNHKKWKMKDEQSKKWKTTQKMEKWKMTSNKQKFKKWRRHKKNLFSIPLKLRANLSWDWLSSLRFFFVLNHIKVKQLMLSVCDKISICCLSLLTFWIPYWKMQFENVYQYIL